MLITPILPLPIVSVENIAVQTNDAVRRELILAIEDMRAKSATDKKLVFDGKRLNEIFANHMKLTVIFNTSDQRSANAYAVAPQIDINHPLVNKWRKLFMTNTEGVASVRWGGEGVAGEVDLVNAKVSGFYQKLVNYVYITETALLGDTFTAPELAAIVLHEVGHIMTYYMMLGQLDTTCYILTDFVRQVIGAKDPKVRVKLFTELNRNTGIDMTKSPEALNSTDSTVLSVLLLSEITENTRSEFGSSQYDMRSWESMSDQFAARMGSAKDLATALAKVMVHSDPMSYRNTFTYFVMELVKVLTTLALLAAPFFGGPGFMLMIGVYIISVSPVDREYDKPLERITRLRNELIAQTKNKTTPKERLKDLIEDIAALDTATKGIKDRQSFYELIWTTISPYSRRQKNIRKELQELETLVNNDLFLSSAKLNIV